MTPSRDTVARALRVDPDRNEFDRQGPDGDAQQRDQDPDPAVALAQRDHAGRLQHVAAAQLEEIVVRVVARLHDERPPRLGRERLGELHPRGCLPDVVEGATRRAPQHPHPDSAVSVDRLHHELVGRHLGQHARPRPHRLGVTRAAREGREHRRGGDSLSFADLREQALVLGRRDRAGRVELILQAREVARAHRPPLDIGAGARIEQPERAEVGEPPTAALHTDGPQRHAVHRRVVGARGGAQLAGDAQGTARRPPGIAQHGAGAVRGVAHRLQVCTARG